MRSTLSHKSCSLLIGMFAFSALIGPAAPARADGPGNDARRKVYRPNNPQPALDPLVGPLVPPPAPVQTMPSRRPAPSLAGTWDWFNGVVITLGADYSAAGTNGQLGSWRIVDPNRRLYVIEWQAGWVDTLELSPDGSVLDGGNQHGTRVSGRRRAAAAPVVVVAPAGAEVVGTFQGVHQHWRDTVTISADGRYWRGNGDGGRWTYDGRILTLHWDRWGTEPLEARGPGYFVSQRNSFSLRKYDPSRYISR